MSAAIINQPWADVADDVTAAIEKAVQPLLKKATDEIYAGLLDTTQDYLRDNLAFNVAERIDAAERQADHDRRENEQLRQRVADLEGALKPTLAIVHLQNGNLHDDVNQVIAQAEAALLSERAKMGEG